MSRFEYTFAEFRDLYINKPFGYYPVYSTLAEDEAKDEDEDSNSVRVIKIDMICEWRLADDKVRFIQVAFDTAEELEQIKTYLRAAAEDLNKEILGRIDDIRFPADNPEA